MARIVHDPAAKRVTIDDGGFARSEYGCVAGILGVAVVILVAAMIFRRREGLPRLDLVGVAIGGLGTACSLLAYAFRPRILIDLRLGLATRRGPISSKSWPVSGFERVYLTYELRDDPESADYREPVYQIFLSGRAATLMVAEESDKATARSLARELSTICNLPFRDGLRAQALDEQPPGPTRAI